MLEEVDRFVLDLGSECVIEGVLVCRLHTVC